MYNVDAKFVVTIYSNKYRPNIIKSVKKGDAKREPKGHTRNGSSKCCDEGNITAP